MAYNNYFPQYYQPVPQMPQMGQMQNQQTTANNTGFVSVPSEMEARNYPVAYGNSVTFKDEKLPYIYTKTMGFSQLEPPRFEKYKLVKEEAEIAQEPIEQEPKVDYATQEDFEKSKSQIESLKNEIEDFKTDFEELEHELSMLKKKLTSKKVTE